MCSFRGKKDDKEKSQGRNGRAEESGGSVDETGGRTNEKIGRSDETKGEEEAVHAEGNQNKFNKFTFLY